MKTQPVDDLVDHLAFAAHGDSDQFKVGAGDRLHDLAVGRVVGGPEHVLGIERGRDASRQRPIQCARQCRAIGAVDQDRLTDQREIFRAGAVFISLADARRKRSGDAACEKRSDVQLLPDLEIGPDHDRDLGVELH